MNRRGVLLGAIVSMVLVLAACSGDDQSGGTTSSTTNPTTSSTAGSDPTSTTPATEPPGTDRAAVTPILQSLVDRYDKAVAAILADPRVAANSDHEAVVSYLRLFTPGSAFAEGALRSWTREGEGGRFYRAGPRGQLTQSTVMAVTSSSANEVSSSAASQSTRQGMHTTRCPPAPFSWSWPTPLRLWRPRSSRGLDERRSWPHLFYMSYEDRLTA